MHQDAEQAARRVDARTYEHSTDGAELEVTEVLKVCLQLARPCYESGASRNLRNPPVNTNLARAVGQPSAPGTQFRQPVRGASTPPKQGVYPGGCTSNPAPDRSYDESSSIFWPLVASVVILGTLVQHCRHSRAVPRNTPRTKSCKAHKARLDCALSFAARDFSSSARASSPSIS